MEYGQESIERALEFLQTITTTDKDHRAEWWDTDEGKILINQQNIFIDKTKRICLSAAELGCTHGKAIIFNDLHRIFANKEVFGRDKKSYDFFETEFGKKFLSEFTTMVNSFITRISYLT